MQQRQTSRRRRPSSSNPRSMGQAAAGQSNGRLDVRVRGNAHQLLEKYKQMARDSQQAGDRVASEFYLQHADHYFRVLNEGRLRQEEMRARRSGNDQLEDDSDAADTGRGRDSDAENARGPAASRSEKSGDDTRSRRRAPRNSERSRDNAKMEKAQPRSEQDDEDDVPQVLELHLTDGEAALAAFAGGESDQREETAAKIVRRGKPDAESGAEAGAEDAVAAEAPAPRRRGRPRKTAQPADS